jgi:putative nucleotidyltransferase with HDIG domain
MTELLITGAACWVSTVIVVLACLRAAGRAEDAGARHQRELGLEATPAPAPSIVALRAQHRRRRLAGAEAAALVVVAVIAAYTSRGADWDPVALTGLLAALAIAGDLRTFRARRFRISASLPAMVVAMALLGPAPAVAIGIACALADAALSRPRVDQFTSNLLAYSAPPLLGALVMRAGGGLGGEHAELALAGLVIVVYMATTGLNFLLIAGHTALLARGGLRDMVRTELAPVLSWEVGAAALAAAAVYVHGVRGAAGIAVLALAGIAFQWLLRAVMEGQRRGSQIEHQAEVQGLRDEGMIALVLGLLSLRDPAFTRHAISVAHRARALARAAGLSEREQDVVHLAGLLHDVGAQSFPDRLLARDQEVDEEARSAIRRHPVAGARLLREVPGMWEVAEAIETHHERVDGAGYPYGLVGSRIPRTARIVAVAEVYDVLTAEESYRGVRDHEWAARELRRVAGTQLDSGLVDVFLASVSQTRPRPSLHDELPGLRRALGLFGARPAAG